MAKTDGAAGARWAASMLGIAACAEVSHATLDEDCAKVDLKLSYRDPFSPKDLISIHAQVKSGPSYQAASSNERVITLNIDKATLDALHRSPNLGVVLWVPPKPQDRIYWYADLPRSPAKSPAKLPRTQYVTPSIGFDFARLCKYANWTQSVPMQTVGSATDEQIMQKAKAAYKKLKAANHKHPLVGELAVTRLAWRHVTRRSKTSKRRIKSLRAVPHLKLLMDKAPDRFVTTSVEISKAGKRTTDTRFLLCWYRKALEIDGKKHSVLLRIKEQITYPTNWKNTPLPAREIKQSATLASWWCKEAIS